MLFPQVLGPDREQSPILDSPFRLNPFAPNGPLLSPSSSEVGPFFQDMAKLLPIRGLDLMMPLLSVGGREFDAAIQDLLSHLDDLLPRWNPEPTNPDWSPWLIVVAGAGAAIEVGRRIVLDRLEDVPSTGPVPIP